MRRLIIAVMLIAPALCHAEILADIWVTKYALTRGIQHEKAKLEAGGRVAFTSTSFYLARDFELSQEQAEVKAEMMRRKEIASLERKINKLQSMRFGEEK